MSISVARMVEGRCTVARAAARWRVRGKFAVMDERIKRKLNLLELGDTISPLRIHFVFRHILQTAMCNDESQGTEWD